MGAHLERGRLLLRQLRYDLALKEFQEELAENAGCPTSHALAAVCLINKKEIQEALTMAERAIGLGPDQDLPYYAMAKVEYARGDFYRALGYIEEAIRIDPNKPDWRSLRSAYLYDTRRWPESLAAAEEGLRLNPMHVGCQNMRGMALLKLGRPNEARQSLRSTLEHSPESSGAHAVMGWSQLESGEVSAALQHFGEALRIAPDSEYARSGLVAALKARNPIYRVMLTYFLWMSRHSKGTRIAVVLGAWFALQILDGMSGLVLLFLLMTWIADPLFNLLLFFHPVGRHALSDDQRRTAKSVGILLGLASMILLLCVVWRSEVGYFLAGAVACLVLPYSAIRRVRKGWKRVLLSSVVGALTVAVAVLTVVALLSSTEAERVSVEKSALIVSGVGSFVTLLTTNLLRLASRTGT